MKKLLMLLIGMVFLAGIATPAWAPIVTKTDKPKPQPKADANVDKPKPQPKGNPNVVDLSDKKSQVPKIPPTPASKQEKQSPR